MAAPMRDAMQIPSATLMHAVATWLARSVSSANGSAAAHTVATPTIHVKNVRGLGVVNASPWAGPVATRASRKAAPPL